MNLSTTLETPVEEKDDKFYFDLGLCVLDLTKKEWEARDTEHTENDLIDIGKEYNKGMDMEWLR